MVPLGTESTSQLGKGSCGTGAGQEGLQDIVLSNPWSKLSSPPHPGSACGSQRPPERGRALCDALSPKVSLSHQDVSPGRCTTWQQLIHFGLQRASGVGRLIALPS